jgi:DNA-binding NarL/FixJ family response regulator
MVEGLEVKSDGLTPREIDVLRAAINPDYKGCYVLQAAAAINRSPNTVKTHVRKLSNRLGTHDILTAGIMALQQGILTLEEILGDKLQECEEAVKALFPEERTAIIAFYEHAMENKQSSIAEVATSLTKSPHTIRTQLKSIYSKLGIHNREQLASYAYIAAQQKQESVQD